MKARKTLIFAILLAVPFFLCAFPANALPSTGTYALTQSTHSVYTTYSTDDGYMPMRELLGLNLTWDTTALTITMTVATLTNTTAAWNNTGFTVTLSNGSVGQQWLPQWSSTHFNATSPLGNWTYCVLIQNVTGGLGYSYVVNTAYNYNPFSNVSATISIPTTPANTIVATVPWAALAGMQSSDTLYVTASSYYCYSYGTAATGTLLTKFIDLISPANHYAVIPQPSWGYDPDGYSKYEVVLLDYGTFPEFPVIWLLLGALLTVGAVMLFAKKKLNLHLR
jgi:hypothetical protein